jgi:hypothetical protein
MHDANAGSRTLRAKPNHGKTILYVKKKSASGSMVCDATSIQKDVQRSYRAVRA